MLTSDGVLLATREWPAAGRPRGVVVLVHGFASSKDDPKVAALAAQLADRGMDVIAYDARGHGESDGAFTLGDLEARDVAAAVAWARQRPGPVVLVGASLGGVAVLRHAASTPDVAGLVVVSTPSEWRIPLRIRALIAVGLTRTRFGRWVSARKMGVRIHPVWTAPEPPRVLIGRVTLPVAIVHGYRDRMIPHRAAFELHVADSPFRRLVLVTDMGHAFDPPGQIAICEAVDWVLGVAVAEAS